MADLKVRMTKNYATFVRSSENRPTDLTKHRKLEESMRRYGFLRSYPIVCVKAAGAEGRFVVKDGQHRLHIAAALGLHVYWIEETVDFDIAVVNSTSKGWTVHDYAAKYASDGKADYQAGLDFAKEHGIPLGNAFMLLAGTTTFGNCQPAFTNGDYEVKDREWANRVMSVYVPVCAVNPQMKKATFLSACMAACRVEAFDPKRLLAKTKLKPELLKGYSSRESCLEMLEELYNYCAKPGALFPLKLEACKVMAARKPAKMVRGGEQAAT